MLIKHVSIVKALSSLTVNRFKFFQMKFSKSISRSVALDLERLSSGMISRKVLNLTEPYFPPETLSSPLGVLVPLSGCPGASLCLYPIHCVSYSVASKTRCRIHLWSN